jgi:hypothetical protein
MSMSREVREVGEAGRVRGMRRVHAAEVEDGARSRARSTARMPQEREAGARQEKPLTTGNGGPGLAKK